MSKFRFAKVIQEGCRVDLNTADDSCGDVDVPGTDVRCADPAFRKANPELCKDFPQLIIKPGVLSLCQLASKQFEAFLYAAGKEEKLTSGLEWFSSDHNVASIGGISGKVTGLGEGIATISVTWQNLSAYAQVTVLPEDCCDDTKVGTVVIVDNSLSMTMQFSAQYATKLAYAKALAYRYVAELNAIKDVDALMSFSEAGNVILPFTDDVQALKNAVAAIPSTTKQTNIEDAIHDAIELLDAETDLTTKVIVLISDLWNNEGGDPNPLVDAFEESGGIVVVVGVRASGTGYQLGNELASGGFFLNAHRDSAKNTLDTLSGMKGYWCAGNCVPPGDVYINKAKLQYFGFANWDVAAGAVDLIGGTPPYDLYDLLPGHGLYVDMVGSAPWPLPPDPNGRWNGKLVSKQSFGFESATTYRLTFKLAGNQRQSVAETPYHHRLRVIVEGYVNQVIEIADWLQDFTEFTYDFTTGEGTSGKISFEQIEQDPTAISFGLLLDDISLVKDPTGTPEIIFEDDFNTENSVYIPPACGPSGLILGYTGYYCYGYGCLTVPPEVQTEDPLPQPDSLEGAATTPPPVESPTYFNPAGQFPTISYVDQRFAALLQQSKDYTDEQLEDYLPLAGGEMTGFITLHATPEEPMHAATKAYVDAAAGGTFDDFVDVIGDTMTGDLIMEDARIGFSPGVGTEADAFLSRISANSLGLVSGADPQSFHIYRLETTSPAATERISIGWSGVQAYVTTEATGAGGQRDLVLNGQLNISDGLIVSISDWTFNNTGIVGLYLNQLTQTQLDAIGVSGNGGIIFNSTTAKYQGLIGGSWVDFATGSISYPVTSVNGQTGDVDLDDEYVSLTGDSMTGLLSIAPSTNTAALTLTGFTPAAGSGSAAPAVLNVTGGVGGTSAVFAGGQGGGINLTAGAGGDSTSAFDTGGIGGSITLTPGAGGSGPMGGGSAGSIVINGNLLANFGATFLGALNGSYLSLNNPPANTNSIYVNGYSVTGANTTQMFDLYGTWNTTGAPTAIRLNITDTASASSGSYLMDLGVGGGSYVSKWWVDKAGKVRQTGGLVIAMTPTDASALTVTGYSLTGSNAQSLVDISGTWNTTGTPTLIKANVTDTASNAASLLLDLQAGGTSQFKVQKDGQVTFVAGSLLSTSGTFMAGGVSGGGAYASTGVFLGSAMPVQWSSTVAWSGTRDLYLYRDAANTLALRNGVNAQAFRVYNTYTDASNYERAFFRWGSNQLQIGTENAGTGVARLVLITSAGDLFFDRATLASNITYFRAGGTTMWTMGAGGHFLAGTDNTYDIGASGATRPRNVYTGGFVSASGEVASQVGFNSISTGYYWFNGRLIIRSPSDGVVRFTNNAADGFTELQLYTDVILARDAANILALRNSTNAQEFRIFNTYTDASNYERLQIGWSSNTLNIRAQAAGTGTVRNVQLAGTWTFGSTGMLFPSADNLYDIGISGTFRVRNAYLAGTITVSQVAASFINLDSQFYIDGGGADGVGVFYNQAFTSFGRICLGGLTNAFPAIKRNGAGIDFRVADDTAYARITALDLILTKGTLTDPSLVIDSTVTWNDAADTFTAWKLNVTNTNSAAASLLMDLQVGGVSQMNVTRDGTVIAGGSSTAVLGYAFGSATTSGIYRSSGPTISLRVAGTNYLSVHGSNYVIVNTQLQWANGNSDTTGDVVVARDAADTLGMRRSTNAQAFNLYGTYTDASNYERLYLKGVASASFEIGTIKAGTGTARSLLLNPETGIIQLMGTSNAFPAFKRNSTSIEIRLADDSGYANLRAEYLHCFGLTVDDNGAAPALGGSSPSFSDYYGTNGKALADPDIWITVNVDGTNRRIPCYNA